MLLTDMFEFESSRDDAELFDWCVSNCFNSPFVFILTAVSFELLFVSPDEGSASL